MSENKQLPFRTVTGKINSQITCGGKTKFELWRESRGECLDRPTRKWTLGPTEENKNQRVQSKVRKYIEEYKMQDTRGCIKDNHRGQCD